MKKVLFLFLVFVGIIPSVKAQNNSQLHKSTKQLLPATQDTMPIIYGGLYPTKSANRNISIGGRTHKTSGQIAYPISDASLDYRKSKRNAIWRDNVEFSNEDWSKLPAVNTGDIIKILDKDGVLTNW